MSHNNALPHTRVFNRIHQQISSVKLSLHRLTLLLQTAKSLSFTADRELKLKVIAVDLIVLQDLLNNVMRNGHAENSIPVDSLVDELGRAHSRSPSPSPGDTDHSSPSKNSQRESGSTQILDTQLLVDDSMPASFSAGLALANDSQDKSSTRDILSAGDHHQYSYVPLTSNPQFIQSPYFGIFQRSTSSSSSSSDSSRE
jgi:hypothetical protein